MSFVSNGVDRVRSLRKIAKQLNLANFGVNGASSASFASTFETVRNALKHASFVEWCGSGAFVAKNSDATLYSELVR
jgi:hypothetical protein